MPITVAFEKTESGHYRAEFDDPAAPPVEAPSLEELLDALKPVLAIEIPDPLTDEERAQQDADDIAASDSALREVAEHGSIP